MEQYNCTYEIGEATNHFFEREVYNFLRTWVDNNGDRTLFQFDQSIDVYLANEALRDFFMTTEHPVQSLLSDRSIAEHLGRCSRSVYFDPLSGDPLLAQTEQRIYNLARRLDSELMHVPFRSIHPNKQTDTGDPSSISSYPKDSEEIRYNSGNHFSSRPANTNVFDEHSKRCTAKSGGNLHVFVKYGYLEDRLEDVRKVTAQLKSEGETNFQFFVIYSRHSPTEGHFGVSLVVMDPLCPNFPKRVLVCDTLLKELPMHPRWWNHFVAEYSNVFGDAIAGVIEDLSHPLQKVNIKGDDPYRHDWNCPYYAASMADALAEIVKNSSDLILNGSLVQIHTAMKSNMSDYYEADCQIKDRVVIQQVNKLKRWDSGSELVKELIAEASRKSSYGL